MSARSWPKCVKRWARRSIRWRPIGRVGMRKKCVGRGARRRRAAGISRNAFCERLIRKRMSFPVFFRKHRFYYTAFRISLKEDRVGYEPISLKPEWREWLEENARQ